MYGNNIDILLLWDGKEKKKEKGNREKKEEEKKMTKYSYE